MGGGVRVIFRLAITYLLALKFVFKVNTQLFQESKKANGCFVAEGGGGGGGGGSYNRQKLNEAKNRYFVEQTLCWFKNSFSESMYSFFKKV